MRRVACLGATIAITFACACPTVAAGASTVVFEGGNGGTFGLRASNGYAIQVSAFGRRTTLSVIGHESDATYTVSGHASSHRIVAGIGSRGKIDMRFRQTEGYRLRRPPKRCEGLPRIKRFGVFVGTIVFRGEHGYTQVDDTRAQGTSYREPRWKCKRRPHGKFAPEKHESGSDGEKPTVLQAVSRDRRVAFAAISDRRLSLGGTIFIAELREHRKRMAVTRFAFVSGPRKDFEFDEVGLTTATVRPPKPFSGSATFTHGPKESTRWSGMLRVDLPGAPHLALTGHRFKALLEQPPFFARWLRVLGGTADTGR